MSRDYDRQCAEHQRVIDNARAYIRLHPGAGEDEVMAAIPHDDTPEYRGDVRTALLCEARERR